jgi:hypothetical protein
MKRERRPGLVMSGDDDTDKNPEQHSTNKWHDHKPSGLTKAIAALVVYGLFIFIDVHDIWPWSHIAAVSVGILVTIALLYLEAFATGAIGFLSFLICSAVIVLSGLAIYREIPLDVIPDVEVIGTLQPGAGADPPNTCPRSDSPDAWKIFAGDMAIQFAEPLQVTVLKFGECRALTIKKDDKGLSVEAQLFDASGKLIATIGNNEFHALSGENVHVSRDHDLSRLIVVDGKGNEILFVQYVNKSSVRVRGVFSCPGYQMIPMLDGHPIPMINSRPGVCMNALRGTKITGAIFGIN